MSKPESISEEPAIRKNRQPKQPLIPVSLADILAARQRIGPYVRRTPLVPSAWLSDRSGGHVSLKLESLQVTNSFKSRGALNAAAQLAAGGAGRSIVTASAGNHGRAVAWAAELLGLRAIVYTPVSAPRAKTDAIRRHGAVLHAEAADYEEAERLAQAHARAGDATFVSPYDHPDVIAGAGTIGVELMQDAPDLDAVLVPVGGGGLISGVAVALKAIKPSLRVIGVEVEASCAFFAARRAGRIVTIDVGETVADGLGGNVDPGTMTWPVIRDLVDDILLVEEGQLRAAVRGLLAEDHLVAEGAGAAAVAAVASGAAGLEGQAAAILLTGANIDIARLTEILMQ